MLAVLSILGMIVLDQAVKLWAVRVLASIGDIPLINGIFHLTYVENRGSAKGAVHGIDADCTGCGKHCTLARNHPDKNREMVDVSVVWRCSWELY